jgi:RNA polymerase sigma-70 factor (ECF subfamily)
MASESSLPDETLVARVAGRQQEAFACLYDRYRGTIFGLALRILRDRPEAEEVLTDTFLHAWDHALAFDPNRGSVAGWLVTCCRSRAIDRLRARGRREAALGALGREPGVRSDAGRAGGGGPEEHADLLLKRRRIRTALGALALPQREAIELAYYGGLSHSEIASTLGEPLGTVKTRIRQGLIALRESLGGQLQP